MKANYTLKILVVDDNKDDFDTMNRVVKKINFPCNLHWCDSGQSACDYLEKLSDERRNDIPNLIFLDINMPGIDGKQTLEKIKSNKKFSSIPIIMFTTSGNEIDVKDCYSLGANSYIQKPHSYEELIKIFQVIDKYWIDVNALPNIR